MTVNPKKVNWQDVELEALRPAERITISQWAPKYRELGGSSAFKGSWRNEMVPFMVPIMDACGSRDIDEVGCCKPAQISGTESLVVNVIGYFTDQEPSAIMVCLEDQKTCEYVNENKIQTMYQSSTHLRRLYDKKRFNKHELSFPNNARVDFAWASSIALLGTKTSRIGIGDEIDKSGWNATGKEAGRMSLFYERTSSYPIGLRKHIWLSTPTVKEGNITVMMNTFDIVYDWHVPCPHCGQKQPLRWSVKHQYGFKDGLFRDENGDLRKLGQVVWEGGRNASPEQIEETARYQCGECEELWTNVERKVAVGRGKMVSRTEEKGNERKVFFHITRLLSLFDSGRLDVLVKNWCDIYRKHGDEFRKAMQGFINSTLAEPFEEVVTATTDSKILKARTSDGETIVLPPQTVPEEAVCLSAFVDHQKYGFWFGVRAWAKDFTSWLIHFGQLSSWDEVENLLFKAKYPVLNHEGLSMKIWRAGLDTGGGKKYQDMSMTEDAYWWLRDNGNGRGRSCQVWGTKGANRPLPDLVKIGKTKDKTPSGKHLEGGLSIVELDTNKLKDMFHNRLALAREGRSRGAYLHDGNNYYWKEYVSHILAEEKKILPGGITAWEKVKKRNDLLDVEVGNIAVVDPSWVGGGLNLVTGRIKTVREKKEDIEKVEAPARRKSGFVNRWKD